MNRPFVVCHMLSSLDGKIDKNTLWLRYLPEHIRADEAILGEDGLIDAALLQAISYDAVHNAYRKVGEKVGNAFQDGNAFK